MALLRSTEVEDQTPKQPVPVGIRLMFQRIGEIDTLNEKYQAHASIEARWIVESAELHKILPSSDRANLEQGKTVSLVKYAETNWHPQLFIENAIGDLKEQVRHSAKKISDYQICVCEHRDVKGVFWEKLELNHFPADIQELQISVGSMFFNDRVILIPDPFYHSGVNREAFIDQQEWSLYEHVDAKQRFVREFFNSITDEEITQTNLSEGRQRSFVSISCHAARSSAYFYWNGYCLVFLITICGFSIFSMPPNLPQNRLQTGATLLLTSITFRWTVNRSLPTISYLTSLDKYAIMSIFILVLLCIWHAIIGAIIYIDGQMGKVDATQKNAWIDRIVFIVLFSLYAFMHIFMIIWLFRVPLARRREWKRKDDEYRETVSRKVREMQTQVRPYNLTVSTNNGYQMTSLVVSEVKL